MVNQTTSNPQGIRLYQQAHVNGKVWIAGGTGVVDTGESSCHQWYSVERVEDVLDMTPAWQC